MTAMLIALVFMGSAQLAVAAPLGTAFTYQGRLMDGPQAANGEYDITFALFDSLLGTNQLGFLEFIEKEIQDGVVMLTLDFGQNAFTGQARWLEMSIRRNDSGAPYTRLLGRQQLLPVPYSLLSADVANGVITSNKLAVGAVTRSNLAPLSVTSEALNSSLALGGPGRGEGLLDFFDGAERVIQLDAEDREIVMFGFSGRPGASINADFGGEIRLFDNLTNDLTVRLSAGATPAGDLGGLVELFSSSNPLFPSRRQVNLNSGVSGGQLELYNRSGNRTLLADGSVGDLVVGPSAGPFVRLGAGGGLGIGWLGLYGPNGGQRVDLRADAMGEFRLFGQTVEAVTLRSGAQPDANSGGSLFLRQPTGQEGVRLYANGPGGLNPGGLMRVFQGNGMDGISLVGHASQISLINTNGSESVRLSGPAHGELDLRGSDGLEKVRLAAAGNIGGLTLNNNLGLPGAICLANFFNGGGSLVLNNTNGQNRVLLDGGSAGGKLSLYNTSSGLSVDLRSQFSAGNTAAWMGLNDNGATRITFAARNGSTGVGGLVGVLNGSGVPTVLATGDTGGGNGKIALLNPSGTETVGLYANFTGGKSRVVTHVLQITGGSDLSEQFDINAVHEELKPGMVVAIDPDHPGQLVVSTKRYDRTVAGIVSGAGGVMPGMLMGQTDTTANGRHPVALTGRVYCLADADEGAIRPGDLLTTADVPGHAMKVADHAAAQGAIIGKAMTALKSGQGLVLVLVSLQ
jgi:hypothetical protein